MPAPLGVGLLGCGRLGREVMLPLLMARDDVTLVVVAEPDAEACGRPPLPAPTRVVADWQSALDHPGLDAVIAALPTALHADAALAALSRGVAIYLEKPMAATHDQARAVHAAWRGSGIPVGVGFNGRFHPLVRQLRDRIDAGRIGIPRAIRLTFGIAATPASWRRPSAEGGGVLRDLASHHVDLARFLLAREFLRVSATHVVSGDDETVAATGELESGIVLSATWASGTVDEDVVEVAGSQGAVRLSRYEDLTAIGRGRAVPDVMTRLTRGLPTPRGLGLWLAKRRSPWHDPSFAGALDNFLRAVRNRTAVVPGVEEGLECAAVVAAIDEAARSGRTVEVDRGVRTNRN